MGAAAVNDIVSPWFVRTRPAALSHGPQRSEHRRCGVLAALGGRYQSTGIPDRSGSDRRGRDSYDMVLADLLFSRTPQQMGLRPDGDAPLPTVASVRSPAAQPQSAPALWGDLKFSTLSAGMALGLFAQIGLITHLFSLLVPALGPQPAALAMGLATAS